MFAICAGIAVGIMVARGGEGNGVHRSDMDSTDVRAGARVEVDATFRDGLDLHVVRSPQPGDAPEVVASERSESGSTRLVIGNLATADGEPEVIAAAVERTHSIPEPEIGITPVPVRGDWNVAAIDRFLEGSPLAGMGSVFVAAANEYGIDPRLMPAIALWESSKCAFQAAAFNCWGLTSGADAQGRLIFRPFGSYEEGIYAVTRTYAGYGVGDYAALCRWVSGKDNCTSDYPAKVLATVDGIR